MAPAAVRKKTEAPLDCPRCKVAPEVRRKGSYWRLVCPNNHGIGSTCRLEGWTMGTKRDAVEQWNIEVRKVCGDAPPAPT